MLTCVNTDKFKTNCLSVTLLTRLERENASKNAVERLFDRERGVVKLFDPPFGRGNARPGYIRSYGEGFRENGGQYTHGAVWLAMACFKLGLAEDGWAILRALMPETHDARVYGAEPFVLPADVYTAENLTGRAGWTWYTGAAGWAFRIITEEILGLRLRGGKLYLRPNLPERRRSARTDRRLRPPSAVPLPSRSISRPSNWRSRRTGPSGATSGKSMKATACSC